MAISEKMFVSKTLLEALSEVGWSVQELAYRLDVDEATITRYGERSEFIPVKQWLYSIYEWMDANPPPRVPTRSPIAEFRATRERKAQQAASMTTRWRGHIRSDQFVEEEKAHDPDMSVQELYAKACRLGYKWKEATIRTEYHKWRGRMAKMQHQA